MRKLLIKFPSQIRISGWDFGSSARAMNQAGVKDSLMTYESVSKTQAELRTVRRSTTERKSMSTKTTIKRIALVAVSALGLGVLSSVAPASAATAGSYTIGTPSATVATTGVAFRVNVPVTLTTGANGETATVSILTSTSVSGSTVTLSYPTQTGITAGTQNSSASYTGAQTSVAQSSSNSNKTITDTLTNAVQTNYPLTVTNSFGVSVDKAGTYVFAVIDDKDGDSVLDAGETAQYVTVTVTDAPAVATTHSLPISGTFATTAGGLSNGAWVKISTVDSASGAAVLNNSQMVMVTVPSGLTLKAVGGSSVNLAGPGQYGLTNANFSTSGIAYAQFTAATAGTYVVQTNVAGSTSTAATTSLTFATAAVDAVTAGALTNLSDASVGAGAYVANGGSVNVTAAGTGTQVTTATSTSVQILSATAGKVQATVTNTSNAGLFGGAAYAVDLILDSTGGTAVAATATDGSASKFASTLTIATALSRKSNYDYSQITITPATAAGVAVGGNFVITGATAAATTLSLISPAASSILSAAGATIPVRVKCVDQFGAGKANIVLTPSISGRNVATTIASAVVTDASGYASFSYTDASTSTTALRDTVSFTGCGSTTSMLTVNYTATANLGVNAIAWTAGGGYGDATSYAGANKTVIGTGDGTSSASLTFKVTDVNGAAIAGVPVTFAVDAVNSSAIVKKTSTVDYATVYTGTDGKATTYVYAYKPGKATVTATAQGKTATGYITWTNPNTNADARNIAATYANGVISVKVTDRFGNGVNGASVTLTRTGVGFFGNGASSYTQAVGEDGTLDVQWAGGAATVKAALTTKSDQSLAPAGQYDNTAGDTYTAAVAGTTTGYGASFAPAGNFEATVDVDDQSGAAVDAANEATDAANAATDAANAAAEAADAATAAAQDAQAAVAALATSVASLIAGIKAQITTLTNLVIKIQKKVRA